MDDEFQGLKKLLERSDFFEPDQIDQHALNRLLEGERKYAYHWILRSVGADLQGFQCDIYSDDFGDFAMCSKSLGTAINMAIDLFEKELPHA